MPSWAHHVTSRTENNEGSVLPAKNPMKHRPKAFFDMLANTHEVVAKATTCPPGSSESFFGMLLTSSDTSGEPCCCHSFSPKRTCWAFQVTCSTRISAEGAKVKSIPESARKSPRQRSRSWQVPLLSTAPRTAHLQRHPKAQRPGATGCHRTCRRGALDTPVTSGDQRLDAETLRRCDFHHGARCGLGGGQLSHAPCGPSCSSATPTGHCTMNVRASHGIRRSQ